jgi:hypothetical protein
MSQVTILNASPTVGNPESFADDLRTALHLPSAAPDTFEAWQAGFYNGLDRLPCDIPRGYSAAQATAFSLGYEDGVDHASYEEIEAVEKLYRDYGRRMRAEMFAGHPANEFELA